MSKALLVINGEIPSKKSLAHLAEQVDLIVCTDGAANDLLKKDVTPDVVIGDLDSLSKETLTQLKSQSEVIEEPSQYSTDFEKALHLLVNRNQKQVILVGLKGKRFDHAYTNMSILGKYAKNFQMELFDEEGHGFVLHKRHPSLSHEVEKNTTVSLLPIPQASGIETKGLLYPLKDEVLELGKREGQSNLSIFERVEVSIKEGVLVVYFLTNEPSQ